MKTIRRCLMCLVIVQLAVTADAQQGNAGGYPSTSPASRTPYGAKSSADPNSLSPEMQERVEKGRQSDRQRRMVADTNRLVILAAELRSDLSKPISDTPMAEIVHKSEEIEKLAHNVKERMRSN